jgi:hypothetical protein
MKFGYKTERHRIPQQKLNIHRFLESQLLINLDLSRNIHLYSEQPSKRFILLCYLTLFPIENDFGNKNYRKGRCQ